MFFSAQQNLWYVTCPCSFCTKRHVNSFVNNNNNNNKIAPSWSAAGPSAFRYSKTSHSSADARPNGHTEPRYISGRGLGRGQRRGVPAQSKSSAREAGNFCGGAVLSRNRNSRNRPVVRVPCVRTDGVAHAL